MPGLGLGSDRLNAARFVGELVTNCLNTMVNLDCFWVVERFVLADGKYVSGVLLTDLLHQVKKLLQRLELRKVGIYDWQPIRPASIRDGHDSAIVHGHGPAENRRIA